MINYDCTYRRNKITIAPGARFDSLHTAEASQKFALGCELELDDGTGRKFRYAKAGAAALSPHLMGCSALLDAEQIGQIQTAYGASAEDTVFDILCATGHTITDGELKDGWLHVNDGGAAMGDLYLINNNTFVTDDTVMRIELAEKLRNAILATDDISIIKNEFLDIIVKDQSDKTATGRAIGVSRVTVAIGYYYWAQYKGLCSMIIDNGDTVVVNEPVGCPGTYGVDGAAGAVANDGTDEVWGILVASPTADEAGLVRLNLP